MTEKRSTKLGRVLDDEIAHDVEDTVPAGTTATDVEQRAEVARFLGKELWPATGLEIVERAVENGATDEVVDRLRGLELETRYRNLQEMWSELGEAEDRTG